ACVFYGAAQVSKAVDLVLLADAANFQRLHRALEALNARRIAVPRFDPDPLARGHAVHFRCGAPGVEEMRIDIMTRLRDLPDFSVLWERRTVISGEAGDQAERRPLLRLALSGQSELLREALDAEARAEQAKDRAYWAPLKAELEGFRRAERQGS